MLMLGVSIPLCCVLGVVQGPCSTTWETPLIWLAHIVPVFGVSSQKLSRSGQPPEGGVLASRV